MAFAPHHAACGQLGGSGDDFLLRFRKRCSNTCDSDSPGRKGGGDQCSPRPDVPETRTSASASRPAAQGPRCPRGHATGPEEAAIPLGGAGVRTRGRPRLADVQGGVRAPGQPGFSLVGTGSILMSRPQDASSGRG